jgi:hypothetical protein
MGIPASGKSFCNKSGSCNNSATENATKKRLEING